MASLRPQSRRRAALASAPGILALLFVACPATVLAAWREVPNRAQIIKFLNRVDSVAVWSISLPDSAAVGERHGVAVLDVAHVRDRIMKPREWGRAFARALLDHNDAADSCDCSIVREREDSVDVVIPVVEYFVADEKAWIPVVFRDGAAQPYFDQGPGPCVPLGDRAASLMRLVREALPADSALAKDAAPVRRKPRVELGGYVFVEELPVAIERIAPKYPDRAIREGINGVVRVQALVAKDGRVTKTYVVWSLPYLDEPAVTAVRQWRFQPARSEGKPVAVWVLIPVKFRLR
jgi:TonB family protein